MSWAAFEKTRRSARAAWLSALLWTVSAAPSAYGQSAERHPRGQRAEQRAHGQGAEQHAHGQSAEQHARGQRAEQHARGQRAEQHARGQRSERHAHSQSTEQHAPGQTAERRARRPGAERRPRAHTGRAGDAWAAPSASEPRAEVTFEAAIPPMPSAYLEPAEPAQERATSEAEPRGAGALIDTVPSLSAFPLGETPWPPRHRSGVRLLPEDAWGLIEEDAGALSDLRLRSLGLRGSPRTRVPPGMWPKEPKSPARVDAGAFAAAVGALCPSTLPSERSARIAQAALAVGDALKVDPFLLVALSFHQSRCEVRSSNSYGVGLTRVNLHMHKRHIHGDSYRFGRPEGGAFVRDEMSLQGHAFRRDALLNPETNLFFAGLFLKVFEAQCPAIDAPFASAPHRHPVSHVIYGDIVKSPLPEAMILTARRRLLGYYAERAPARCADCEKATRRKLPARGTAAALGLAPPRGAVCAAPLGEGLVSPLDGAPRIVIGILGDAREHGARIHAGVDLLSAVGEPVRAVQRGVVISAGVELKNGQLLDLPPERVALVPESRMGARGIFVRIEHEAGLVSIYSHLAGYSVQVGDRVERGQRIGEVGRSGVQASDAHLHFGLFESGQVVDPLVLLKPYVLFSPP